MSEYITIFTPTYNRLHTLPRLLQSLQRQTCLEFEWIVIDDGSTDETEKFFLNLPKQEFVVRYYKTQNGGKHRAINRAVKLAKGTFMFMVDSDDWITNDAVETIYSWLKELPAEYAAVSGIMGHTETEPMGNVDCFRGVEYLDKTNIERRDMNTMWDMAEVYRVSILKQFPFPEFEGEKFLSEGVVWNQIAKAGHPIRWYGKIIYMAEYLEGGLTHSGKKIFVDNPKGYALYIWQELNYFSHTIKEKVVIYYEFYNDLKSNFRLSEIARMVKVPAAWLYFIVKVMDFRHKR